MIQTTPKNVPMFLALADTFLNSRRFATADAATEFLLKRRAKYAKVRDNGRRSDLLNAATHLGFGFHIQPSLDTTPEAMLINEFAGAEAWAARTGATRRAPKAPG